MSFYYYIEYIYSHGEITKCKEIHEGAGERDGFYYYEVLLARVSHLVLKFAVYYLQSHAISCAPLSKS
jgi:hypothetical protein